MKIAVAGGTGFIGSALVKALAARGHAVTVLSRKPRGASPDHALIVWNPEKPAGLELVLNGYDAFVNLCGESVAFGRWTPERREAMRKSRLQPTAALVDIFSKLSRKPKAFLSASGVGYYGPHGGESLSESEPAGRGFLAELCKDWEAAARGAEPLGIRTAVFRIGIVLGREGGALRGMLRPFRWGLGATLGEGTQWMSWIHADDLVSMMIAALEHATWSGPVNATAPHPATNAAFTRTLARVLRRPAFLRATPALLRLVAGDMADEALLVGQKVLPEKARKLKFAFRHPKLEEALRDLVR